MTLLRRLLVQLGALAVVIVAGVLAAAPAHAAGPTAAPAEPKRALLVGIYVVAVLVVAGVVAWAAYSQWGRRSRAVVEEER
ncbi:MAG: hypothetical protein U0R68_10485 [Candidatus Nanopelagicales bacterium]